MTEEPLQNTKRYLKHRSFGQAHPAAYKIRPQSRPFRRGYRELLPGETVPEAYCRGAALRGWSEAETGKTKVLNAPRWTHLQLRITRRQRYLRTIHRRNGEERPVQK